MLRTDAASRGAVGGLCLRGGSGSHPCPELRTPIAADHAGRASVLDMVAEQ